MGGRGTERDESFYPFSVSLPRAKQEEDKRGGSATCCFAQKKTGLAKARTFPNTLIEKYWKPDQFGDRGRGGISFENFKIFDILRVYFMHVPKLKTIKKCQFVKSIGESLAYIFGPLSILPSYTHPNTKYEEERERSVFIPSSLPPFPRHNPSSFTLLPSIQPRYITLQKSIPKPAALPLHNIALSPLQKNPCYNKSTSSPPLPSGPKSVCFTLLHGLKIFGKLHHSLSHFCCVS